MVNAFLLSPEQELLRETVGRIADDIYASKAAEWDQSFTFLPDEERSRLASLELLGLGLPEEHGGGGSDLLDVVLAIEELAKRNQVAAFQVFEANTGPARVIDLFGTEEQKARYLPPIIRGEATMAVSISEPEAGSAATDLTTTARRKGDNYVVNGMKRWCSGGGHAEQYLVYVRLTEDPGASGIGALVVHRDSEGLSFGPQERLLGFHGIPSADMFFDDVYVPAENLVVDAGGFRRLFRAFSIERLGNATMSLAIGQASLDRTARYVQERRQFGRALVEFQTVHTTIADMLVQVEAARLLIWRAAAGAGRGAPDALETSLAKCFSNEMAKRVSDLAIQLHGGYGYHPEYHVERHHRDSHGWALAGGTPTMQRIRIASEYLERRFDQRS
jgi:alkylation response protein AidB-like acyl-CoA dehydrogenase